MWDRPSACPALRKVKMSVVRLIFPVVLGAGLLPAQSGWKSLFDGKSLEGWRETPFSARGKVRVEDGAIVLGSGAMTGITWTGQFPKANYEVRLEAMRADGSDFF